MGATTEDLVAMARVRDLCRTGTARAIRVGSHSTLDEVAQVCMVSPSSVSLWERGLRIPRGQHALDYLAVLEGLMRR